LRWSWDPIEKNDQASSGSASTAKRWQTGAGNAWSIMAVDNERDLIFIPTGSASPDYYGELRLVMTSGRTQLLPCAERPGNLSGDS
jgi:quinoprotein glucose dehydrogenase